MSLIQSFKALSPKTRMMVGFGILAWGTIGLYASDAAEKKLRLETPKEDEKLLDSGLPTIRVVERE